MAAVVVMLSWAVPAGATTTTNPYASSSGYDVGYPNCNEKPPGGFAIVGLGGGRPFTTSNCLTSEWTKAGDFNGTPAPALYFNTGYAGAYGRDITSPCTTYAGQSLAGVAKHDQRTYTKAWEIGCSEAAFAAGVATKYAEHPSMWWADIETGNSWSTNQTVNQYTVDGLSYEMQQSAPGVGGVYSYPASWDKIVGPRFTATPPFSGGWGPNLSCTTAFGGTPVWVVQGGTSSSGVDLDTGCA
jgi:hypothetical protein